METNPDPRGSQECSEIAQIGIRSSLARNLQSKPDGGQKSISTEISDLNFRIVSWNLSAHKRTDSEDGACVHLPAAEVISPKRCGVWDFAADSRIHPASF